MTRPVDRNGLEAAIKEKARFNSPSDVSPRPPHPTAKVLALQKPAWNTEALPWRFTSDVAAAATTSAVVSPIITMIDRGIIERASTHTPLTTSLRHSLLHLLTRPHLFLSSKPFLLVSTLYFGTFLTANIVDTLTSTFSPAHHPPSHPTAGPAKFAAVSAVNMSLCLYKDSQFTKMFASSAGPAGAVKTAAVPMASYVLFALRDSLTVFASFNLPPRIAPLLPVFHDEVAKKVGRESVAQFLAPAGMQLLSTPLHLWGLDLYNRPAGSGIRWRERVSRVARDWGGSSLARMGRIVPAFGVGGVVNKGMRERLIGGGEQ